MLTAELALLLLTGMQAEGCTVDLLAIGKPYYVMKRICPYHMKVRPTVVYPASARHALSAAVVQHVRASSVCPTTTNHHLCSLLAPLAFT
jgi:hypothetical protein